MAPTGCEPGGAGGGGARVVVGGSWIADVGGKFASGGIVCPGWTPSNGFGSTRVTSAVPIPPPAVKIVATAIVRLIIRYVRRFTRPLLE
jgi:hypothetical protein